MAFDIGATVRLKSGGPVMTVQRLTMKIYSCSWFEGKKLENGSFDENALVLSDPRAPDFETNKKLRFEIWYKGDAIGQTLVGTDWFVPNVGDVIYTEFINENVAKEYGRYWKVVDREILFMGPEATSQTVQLACEPSKK